MTCMMKNVCLTHFKPQVKLLPVWIVTSAATFSGSMCAINVRYFLRLLGLAQFSSASKYKIMTSARGLGATQKAIDIH